MTKTTNYEISKKLSEIGFNAGTDYLCVEDGGEISCVNKFHFSDYFRFGKALCKSYNLETLLDALPEKIKVGESRYRTPQSKLFYFDKIIGYAKEPKIEFQFYCRIQENESLADTAGRLIILLESKNLIKF